MAAGTSLSLRHPLKVHAALLMGGLLRCPWGPQRGRGSGGLSARMNAGRGAWLLCASGSPSVSST